MDKNYPVVSIVIPCFNEEKFIGKCLNSMLKQDYPKNKLEILVVDGMSTDKTKDILNDYKEKHGIKTLENQKKITSTALNIGIKESTGEIIIIFGAHAFAKENFVSKNVEFLFEKKVDCVGGVIKSIGENYWGKVISLVMSSPFGVGNALFRYTKEAKYVDTVAFGAYRREVFKKVGLFDERFVFGQDAEFNFRLSKIGGKIFLSPEIESYYYVRSSIIKLWRQYFRYGRSKSTMAKRHKKIISIRSLVPTFFLLTLFLSGILGIFLKPFLFLFSAVFFSYLLLNIIFSLKISLNAGFKYLFSLILSFFILHFSYGLGFLRGIFSDI